MRHVSERALVEAVLVARLIEDMCDGRPTQLLQRVIELGGGKQETRRKHVPAKHPPLRIRKADLCDSVIDEILRFRRTRGTVVLHRKRQTLLGVRPEVSRRLFANNVLGYQLALFGTLTLTHIERNPSPLVLAPYGHTKGVTSFEVVNSEPDRCVEIVNDIEPRSSYSVVLKNRSQIAAVPPSPTECRQFFQFFKNILVGGPTLVELVVITSLTVNVTKERWDGVLMVDRAASKEDTSPFATTKCNKRRQYARIVHAHASAFIAISLCSCQVPIIIFELRHKAIRVRSISSYLTQRSALQVRLCLSVVETVPCPDALKGFGLRRYPQDAVDTLAGPQINVFNNVRAGATRMPSALT